MLEKASCYFCFIIVRQGPDLLAANAEWVLFGFFSLVHPIQTDQPAKNDERFGSKLWTQIMTILDLVLSSLIMTRSETSNNGRPSSPQVDK